MNTINNLLFWISNGLMVPVVVGLLVLFTQSLLMLGGFYAQYAAKRKTDLLLGHQLDELDAENAAGFVDGLPVNKSLVLTYFKQIVHWRGSHAHIDRLLANFEIDADKDLAKSKTLAKLGPILGLMGTLIPMGPALVGLSTGDIGSMAHHMQVAFATTVVGLVTGGIGYITQQVKQRWYLQDYTNLEFMAKLFTHNTAQE